MSFEAEVQRGYLLATHPHKELIHSFAVAAAQAERAHEKVIRDSISSLSTHDLAAAMDPETWRWVDARVKSALVTEASNRLRSLTKGTPT